MGKRLNTTKKEAIYRELDKETYLKDEYYFRMIKEGWDTTEWLADADIHQCHECNSWEYLEYNYEEIHEDFPTFKLDMSQDDRCEFRICPHCYETHIKRLEWLELTCKSELTYGCKSTH